MKYQSIAAVSKVIAIGNLANLHNKQCIIQALGGVRSTR
jgi:hypothetical protein